MIITNLRDFDTYYDKCPFCYRKLKFFCNDYSITAYSGSANFNTYNDESSIIIIYDTPSTTSATLAQWVSSIKIDKSTNLINYNCSKDFQYYNYEPELMHGFNSGGIGTYKTATPPLPHARANIFKSCDCTYEYEVRLQQLNLSWMPEEFSPQLQSTSFTVETDTTKYIRFANLIQSKTTLMSHYDVNSSRGGVCTLRLELPLIEFNYDPVEFDNKIKMLMALS